MAEEFENQIKADEGYQSVNEAQIEAAREANNTWTFAGREIEKFVARGEASVAVTVLNRRSHEETGATMIHELSWTKDAPFINREAAFKTSLRRVGRSQEQDVETTQIVPVNAEFYAALVQGAILRIPADNGEFREVGKTREEMLEFARLKPEAASEVIETWMDSATVELLEDDGDSFDWIFETPDAIRVLWKLGEKDNPAAAAVLTFKSPSTESRKQFDSEVQRIKSKKQGDVNLAQLSESFVKKLQYGAKHLINVEGIAVGAEGSGYTNELKQNFITLFNPIWFSEAVEAMHESFDFFAGKPTKN